MLDAVATRNRFVWYDLMATAPRVSREFFTRLLGWTTTEQDMGEMGTYTMISVGDTGIGGILFLGEESGVPAHWMAYVMVGDVDAVVARAKELGGDAIIEPQGDPEVARYAVITDPSGAMVAPVKGNFDVPPASTGPPPAGTFCWNELMTTDVKGAVQFYGEIFGWSTSELPRGDAGIYHVFQSEGRDAGGMMQMPADAEHPPFWLSYIAVDDVDANVAKVTELGGAVLVGPTVMPGVGRFAVCTDPTGAIFGIFKGEDA